MTDGNVQRSLPDTDNDSFFRPKVTELDYRSIMSGHRRGLLAMVIRAGLRIAEFPYTWAVGWRNDGFNRGRRPVTESPAVVVSVGNLTTGGTGKTPIVCYVAKWFRGRGIRVAIVSRGYGRGDADANDEALELHDRLPDVPHVQDPDRVEAARIAVEELEAEVVLMDDGFQHRRLGRDLDIVVIDMTCPFGFGHLLPRGLLREPIRGLSRADLVILTRCSSASPSETSEVESTIRRFATDVSIVHSDHRPTELMVFPSHSQTIESLRGQNVAIVCAIGNPHALEQTVRDCGGHVVASRHLPDHDPYSRESVRELQDWVRDLGDRVDQVICTHKDLVKLRTDRLGGRPLAAILIELSITNDAEKLNRVLETLLDRKRSELSCSGE